MPKCDYNKVAKNAWLHSYLYILFIMTIYKNSYSNSYSKNKNRFFAREINSNCHKQ